jgi:hypothetical protein
MRINRRGLIGTTIIHGLILALLILGGLTFPDPPPEEEGVLVNFGTDDTGFGSVEPIGDQGNQGSPEPEVVENIPEEVAETAPPEQVMAETQPADQTQDIEEVVIKEDPKPTAEELRREQEQAERLRKQQEEERIRRAEEERNRKEQEAERKRQEEERQRREQQAERLNRMGENTFSRQGVGEQEGSEGVNPGTGTNQGATTGTPGATNYGDGSGLGNYSLRGRNAVGKLPEPNVRECNVDSRIVVIVEIQVDRTGKVVNAVIAPGGNYSDLCINNAVRAAALATKFTSDQNAPLKQTGTITYTIEP